MPGPRRFARATRRQPGQMNSMERQYSLVLDGLVELGQIDSWKFEAYTLTVADPPNAKKARYTPDFSVLKLPSLELEFHEVKGFMEEDALVKIKAAASQYPHRFWIVRRRTKKQGGGWDIQEV